MKQFFKLSIIVLALVCIATPMTDAKVKNSHRRATTSRSGIPSAKSLEDITMYLENPKKVKQMTGLTRLYYYIEKPCLDNHFVEGGSFIYGKNAKADKRGNVTATGPHAFYYNYCHDFSCEGWEYGFSDESDRDNFWNELSKTQDDMDESYVKKYEKGWFTIGWVGW